jgi:thermitase
LLFPGDDLPDAAADPEWSLGPRGANALPAKAKIRALGREPGNGVVVAHPDTGYRRHPEIWPAVGVGPVLADQGWNYLTGKPEATDDLTFAFPGHGTKTASVIVSPDGDDLKAGPRHWVSGVAPGARIVPMRVTRSVAMLNQANLAQAIRRAAGLGPNPLARPADVVSMSLGGPPSRDLHRAVREAEKKNVIVLAAAGNEVHFVVWPAHYSEVTAVAASNVLRRPWTGSSRGRAVDITAPGESVWVAGTRPQGNAVIDCNGMGSGTSFAVATTAGVAALWLDYHRDDLRLRRLRERGALAWGFRQVLRKTARPGSSPWDAERYGPGIVDALAVLDAEIPAPPAALEVEAAGTPCEADLATLRSLFARPQDANGRIARLLSVPAGALCRVALVGDEIAFLYATDAVVRTALQPVLEEPRPTVAHFTAARDAIRGADSSVRLRAVTQP